MGKQKTKMRRRLELAKPLKMKPEWRGKSVKKKRKGMHVKLPTEKPRKRRLENVKKLSGVQNARRKSLKPSEKPKKERSENVKRPKKPNKRLGNVKPEAVRISKAVPSPILWP